MKNYSGEYDGEQSSFPGEEGWREIMQDTGLYYTTMSASEAKPYVVLDLSEYNKTVLTRFGSPVLRDTVWSFWDLYSPIAKK